MEFEDLSNYNKYVVESECEAEKRMKQRWFSSRQKDIQEKRQDEEIKRNMLEWKESKRI